MEAAANDNYVSNDDYHNREKTPGISASGLIQLSRSPAHFKFWQDNPEEPTPAQIRGGAIHAAILEPNIFERDYVVLDDAEVCEKIGGAKPRATNIYKEWKAEWSAENAGKRVLSLEDYDAARRIADKARAHPRVAELFSEPHIVEGTLRWTDEQTGVQLKARPDLRILAGRIVDIKSTQDARPDAFSRTIYTNGYHIQSATYREGVRVVCRQANSPFVFIAIEAEQPHGIAVYDLDESACQLGDIEFRRCVNLYAKCAANDQWPGYYDGLMPIGVPMWAIEKTING